MKKLVVMFAIVIAGCNVAPQEKVTQKGDLIYTEVNGRTTVTALDGGLITSYTSLRDGSYILHTGVGDVPVSSEELPKRIEKLKATYEYFK